MERVEEAWKVYGRQLHGFALALTRRSQDAEDVLQNVFLGLARAVARLDAIDDLRAYLYRATRNEAVRVRNRRRDDLPAEEVPLLMAAPQDRHEQTLDVSRALAALPEEQREVAVLKLYHRHTFEEIGELVGISPNTAASRFRYALEKLRAALDSREEGGCHA